MLENEPFETLRNIHLKYPDQYEAEILNYNEENEKYTDEEIVLNSKIINNDTIDNNENIDNLFSENKLFEEKEKSNKLNSNLLDTLSLFPPMDIEKIKDFENKHDSIILNKKLFEDLSIIPSIEDDSTETVKEININYITKMIKGREIDLFY